MFNGPQEAVTLRFADKLIGPVLDKFGEDTKMTRVDDHTIEATVQVRIAPTFWGWLFQFGTDMDIVEPEALKEEYIKTQTPVNGNMSPCRTLPQHPTLTGQNPSQRSTSNSTPNTALTKRKLHSSNPT